MTIVNQLLNHLSMLNVSKKAMLCHETIFVMVALVTVVISFNFCNINMLIGKKCIFSVFFKIVKLGFVPTTLIVPGSLLKFLKFMCVLL